MNRLPSPAAPNRKVVIHNDVWFGKNGISRTTGRVTGHDARPNQGAPVKDTAAEPAAEPSPGLSEPKELLLSYLDYYRAAIARKLDGMPAAELRTSRLPSGWTPLELVNHLIHMERRWMRWGFTAEQVDAPWGDTDEQHHWVMPAGATAESLIAALHDGGKRTRAIAAKAKLSSLASTGGRFEANDRRPTLAWTLFHVLQEYARHAGHLDVARELADGQLGE